MPITSTAHHRIRDAEDAVAEVRAALEGAGVILPSVRIDLASCAATDGSRPLIDLGRCNVLVARKLAAVLRGVG